MTHEMTPRTDHNIENDRDEIPFAIIEQLRRARRWTIVLSIAGWLIVSSNFVVIAVAICRFELAKVALSLISETLTFLVVLPPTIFMTICAFRASHTLRANRPDPASLFAAYRFFGIAAVLTGMVVLALIVFVWIISQRK